MQLLPGYNNINKLLSDLKAKPESYWQKRGERRVLRLFKKAASLVPAYKDFLKKHRVNPDKINSIRDFKSIPPTSKDAYLRHYPRASLCWNGVLNKKPLVFSTTSGSTGEPFYFPRTETQDRQYALTAELYLVENFQIDKKKTLYIVGFPMGAWIGGLFTYQALKILAERGKYKFGIITAGVSKTEIIKAVKNLGPEFEQVIIGSYGPFLKDVVDDASAQGLNWKEHNMNFIFSAEGFNEEFRDYIAVKTGVHNACLQTLNHYGTVDLGTMSHETPYTIALRKQALQNKNLYQNLFGTTKKLPTLTQYLPELFYFEEENGALMCTSDSGYPLVKYDLKDHGGVITMQKTQSYLDSCGINHGLLLKKYKIKSQPWQLPLVHVYERSDFSVSFFAFQVYPETIKNALYKSDLLKHITGKFTMAVKYDKNKNQRLVIEIEARPNVKTSAFLKKKLSMLIFKQLQEENSEYKKTSEEYPSRVVPIINIWPYEHGLHFKPGAKQKWIK